MKHLRIHDKNYSRGFKCDFCDHKARDSWNLDKHMLCHFKDTNSKNLSSPLNTFCSMSVDVVWTEFQLAGVCRSVYQMSISKADREITTSADTEINWNKELEDIEDGFKQLGLTDSDWVDWKHISYILGLDPLEDFMSWVGYSKDEFKEVFRVSTVERLDVSWIENLHNEICVEQLIREEGDKHGNMDEEADEICTDIISELVIKAGAISSKFKIKELEVVCQEIVAELAYIAVDISDPKSKFQCHICKKFFKDNAHLHEHTDRMHSEPSPCLICEVMYQDKHSAITHQKLCTRICKYDHCSFQTRHKHTYMKHLRGHEKNLRRFR